MADREVVETVFGKHKKYEIVRVRKVIANDEYRIYVDGKPWRSFSSLKEAVEAANAAG